MREVRSGSLGRRLLLGLGASAMPAPTVVGDAARPVVYSRARPALHLLLLADASATHSRCAPPPGALAPPATALGWDVCVNSPWRATRQAALEALRTATGGELSCGELREKMRELLVMRAATYPTCRRPECDPLDAPPGSNPEFHRMLIELKRRGEIWYAASEGKPFRKRRVGKY